MPVLSLPIAFGWCTLLFTSQLVLRDLSQKQVEGNESCLQTAFKSLFSHRFGRLFNEQQDVNHQMTKWLSCLFLRTWKFLHVSSCPPWDITGHLPGFSMSAFAMWCGFQTQQFQTRPQRSFNPTPQSWKRLAEILWKCVTDCLKERFSPQGTTYTFRNVLLCIRPLSWTVRFDII